MQYLKSIYYNLTNFIKDFIKIVMAIFNIVGLDWSFFRFGLILFSIRFFILDYSMIPSGSMTPTCRTGDIVLVNKFAYGISSQNIHIPYFFMPGSIMWSKTKINLLFVLHKIAPNVKFFDIEPKRGDICVFVLNHDPKTMYCKRIIGISGDTIQMKNGVLHINDEPVLMEKIEETEYIGDKYKHQTMKGTKYKITLPNGVSYNIFRSCQIGESSHDNSTKYKVPKGHVWVQGDFNTDSADSFEFDYTQGAIPKVNLLGKPILVLTGTKAREEQEATSLQYITSIPIRIFVYISNFDFSRVGIVL